MRNKFKKKIVALIVIIFLGIALFLRLYRLNLDSPSLYADETGGHYVKWVELSLPAASPLDWICNNFLIRTLTSVWLFGLTPLGARLPAAIYGTILVLCLYFFAKSITLKDEPKQQIVSLLALFLGGVLPWGIHISRIGHTGPPVMLSLVCLHLIMYLRAKKASDYLLSVLPLVAAIYYYSSMLIISPLVLFLVFKKILPSISSRLIVLLLPLFLVIAVFFLLAFQQQSVRGIDLAIWRDVNVTADTNFSRGLARLSEPSIFSLFKDPELTNKLFYNYPVSVVNVFFRNYLSFFSPDFLFLRGDPVLRHSTGLVGAFYPFLMPFMIYGAFLFFKSVDQKTRETFLVWILLSPIPAAITKDGSGYLLRVLTLMPFLTYLAAFGLVESYKRVKAGIKIPCLLATLLVGGYSIYYFLFGYFHIYPALAAKSYEYGFRQLAEFQLENKNKSMLVVWDGYYPNVSFRFWQETPAVDYKSFEMERIKIGETTFFKTYGNLSFSLPKSEEEIVKFIKENDIAFVALPSGLRSSYKGFGILNQSLIKIINYPDKSPAFYLFSVSDYHD